MTDGLIRITTALAVIAIARRRDHLLLARLQTRPSHGETGMTARLLPFTVDGLIWAASVAVHHARGRRGRRHCCRRSGAGRRTKWICRGDVLAALVMRAAQQSGRSAWPWSRSWAPRSRNRRL